MSNKRLLFFTFFIFGFCALNAQKLQFNSDSIRRLGIKEIEILNSNLTDSQGNGSRYTFNKQGDVEREIQFSIWRGLIDHIEYEMSDTSFYDYKYDSVDRPVWRKKTLGKYCCPAYMSRLIDEVTEWHYNAKGWCDSISTLTNTWYFEPEPGGARLSVMAYHYTSYGDYVIKRQVLYSGMPGWPLQRYEDNSMLRIFKTHPSQVEKTVVMCQGQLPGFITNYQYVQRGHCTYIFRKDAIDLQGNCDVNEILKNDKSNLGFSVDGLVAWQVNDPAGNITDPATAKFNDRGLLTYQENRQVLYPVSERSYTQYISYIFY